MLKSYNTTLTADTESTLLTVASGHEVAIVTIEFASPSDTGANITLTKNNGTSDIFAGSFSIGKNDYVLLDSKIFLPAGYALKALADGAVSVSISADDSEV